MLFSLFSEWNLAQKENNHAQIITDDSSTMNITVQLTPHVLASTLLLIRHMWTNKERKTRSSACCANRPDSSDRNTRVTSTVISSYRSLFWFWNQHLAYRFNPHLCFYLAQTQLSNCPNETCLASFKTPFPVTGPAWVQKVHINTQ